MEELNLPRFQFKVKETEKGREIWDEFRKKYVVLTPEEWVRQHFLKFLNDYLKYPKSLLKTEFEIKYNKLKKRPDIVAYDNTGSALMVVECKAPEVKISEATFQQAAIYNQTLKAKYLVITNGMDHFCCEQNKKTGTFDFVEKIPVYQS
ncbi:MAG: type I restriction enzyme HsdR N-terminal domain-containing protein [Reichenbachiella sp.]|uniref:type I restriction enzyme HsdR N-terminal domain-containing protein n=1 Tax=Reichenbachiella sp. TaxID=2184521 RepID=UPI00296775B3|nr:type I restriction enzyme HsdR N-terminal domain-containing protein [Reichenbachiella sp.]MDW3210196.1 type I restriction enzyme HsdR N-terminal domain-containing protein [Reichenbachiella sp.]